MEPIREYMEALKGDRTFKDKVKRFIRHKEDQDKISEFNQNLDRAFHAFQVRHITLLGLRNRTAEITFLLVLAADIFDHPRNGGR
jgi:hypothetical protein